MQDGEPKPGLDYYCGATLIPFSMLNLTAIYNNPGQSPVLRSVAHLAAYNSYCNAGSILYQMNNEELDMLYSLFKNSEEELEPYLSGERTLAQCFNLNSISMFCFILARLEGELEIKTGVLQNAFRKLGVMIQQEVNYRKTKQNKPDYAKMSVLN